MSWLEKQTILLVFSISWVLVSSDIYKSVMWTTNNPLFSDSGKLSPCFGKDLEMRVHLQSSLPIVCPFDFIIMKTLPSKPATGVLYENFWIVYDNTSFHNCDIDMTHNVDNERNKKLLECNSPEALKSFTYSIDFKAKTHANSGIAFEGGRYYYFLATSDGTDGSLNNTRGGHCNDPKVHMKFKVYICRTDVVDAKCQNVSIGEFLCPPDLPEATTPPPTTVTSTQTSTQTTTGSTPGITHAPSSSNASTVTMPPPSTLSFSTGQGNNNNENGSKAAQTGSDDIRKELARWKAAAFVFLGLLLLLIAIIAFCYVKRHKKKPGSGLCFTDINEVNPQETHSPESFDVKQPDTKHSFNNLSYSNDSEDEKKVYQMSSFKPTANMYGTSVDTRAQEQNSTQKMEPENPHPGKNSKQIGNGTLGGKENGGERQHVQNQNVEDKERQSGVSDTIAGVDSEQIGNGTLGGKENGGERQHVQNQKVEDKERQSVVSDKIAGVGSEQIGNGLLGGKENGAERQHVQNQNVEDKERQSGVSDKIAGVDSEQIGNGLLGGKENGAERQHVQNQNVEDKERQSGVSDTIAGVGSDKIGNGTPGGKENGGERQHRHNHEDRPSRVSNVVSLPPSKNNVTLKKYSSSSEKQALNGGYLNEIHV